MSPNPGFNVNFPESKDTYPENNVVASSSSSGSSLEPIDVDNKPPSGPPHPGFSPAIARGVSADRRIKPQPLKPQPLKRDVGVTPLRSSDPKTLKIPVDFAMDKKKDVIAPKEKKGFSLELILKELQEIQNTG
jgi:hypothetical protein